MSWRYVPGIDLIGTKRVVLLVANLFGYTPKTSFEIRNGHCPWPVVRTFHSHCVIMGPHGGHSLWGICNLLN